MLNRAIQVRVVKTDKNHPTVAPDHTIMLDDLTNTLMHLGKEGVKVMCLYIALDTVRKVVIAKASM